MKVEELFKQKLEGASVKAPDNLWSKLECELNQLPQNTNLSQNINTTTTTSISSTVKAIAISCGVAAASIGGYLAYNNFNNQETEIKTEITEIQQPMIENAEIITEIPAKETPKQEIKQDEIIIIEEEIPVIPTDTTTPIIETPTPIQNTPVITQPTPVQTPTKQENPKQEVKEPIQEEVVKIKEKTIFKPNVKIPNFISPNNDGINDYFEIYNIESYPNNELIVFDSRGRIVFQASSYNNEWDATNIPQGAYFYKLLIKEGENKKIINGSITIKF